MRDIKWSVENPKQMVNKLNGQPVKAIIEYVRDGSTVRLCMLPDFCQVILMLSGIRVSKLCRGILAIAFMDALHKMLDTVYIFKYIQYDFIYFLIF